MLAKVEKTWMLQPQIVSRGAQKNFADYTIDLKERGEVIVDQNYFEDLVSKLIVWKSTERIVSRQKMPGYRANIVTYTIAWLLFLTGQRIDLSKIWQKQVISDSLANFLDFLAYKVREHITDTEYNVTEWCKKDDAWKKLKNKTVEIPSSLSSELLDTGSPLIEGGGRKLNEEEQKLIEWASSIDPKIWLNISRWGKLTKLLERWENGISYSVGKVISRGKKPSIKQSVQAKRIYEKAYKSGFTPS